MSETMRIGRKVVVYAVVLTTLLWSMMAAVLVAPLKASAAGCVSGSLIKGSLPAVYYCGADGKRYVFTNDKNYFTWYPNFSGVQIVSDNDLAGIQIGGNVTYRPGVRMVKIQSDPKTYAIAHGGSLRWVQTEALASCLWGSNWNTQIDDISDAFFVNYQVGFAITSCADYNRTGEMQNSETINEDKELTAPQPNPPPGAPTVISVSPQNGATNVSLNSTVQATFSEHMNASTINTGTFTLMRGSVAVAGSVSYTNDTATFFPNANLEANTTYTATISTGARDTGGETLAVNYTWSFSTGASLSGSPTVVSTSPTASATNVAIDATVSATFNEAMNASTINTNTFTLVRGSTSVSGSVSYVGNTATFTPSAQLQSNVAYTATITTGAKDSDGNSLSGGAYVWTFTTGNFATGSPSVLSTTPQDGATGVSVGTTITATFSEPMNASTINNGTFTLMQGSTPVAGTVNYSGNTATFTPNASLSASATHTATISTGARDNEGNSLSGGAKSWSFVTAP